MENSPGTVFVTGASGFIGRHIVRLLIQHDYKVRALVRRTPTLPFDPSVDLIAGDLTRPETYEPALSGVSAVVHSALTEDFSGDIQATSTLRNLSARAGVKQFIHLSSIVVYGNPQSGDITEATPPVLAADRYSQTKLAIEGVFKSDSRSPEVAILRLGCVYGPRGGWWTQALLDAMSRGKHILVNAGTGTANLIHVEDVAATVLLLLAQPNSGPRIFNVTDGAPVPWKLYFSALEGILERTATVSMSAEEARQYGRKWLNPSLLRRVIRKMQGSAHIHALDDRAIDFFASTAVYSNSKAIESLGFRPKYDLEAGMLTVSRAN
jgi:nucleoside-diphosphate-sugar epimerase